MGNQSSTMYRLNFEDIQEVIKQKERYILINTLSPNNQSCLLPNTVSCSQEEQIVNHYISHNKDILEVNCDEHNELYDIKYDNFEKTFFNCKKISFDIYADNEISEKSYLECYLKDNKKKFIFLGQSK